MFVCVIVCAGAGACLAGTMKRILNVYPLDVATLFYPTTEGGDAEQTPVSHIWENDYIAFDEYYNEPIGRSFGNCEIPFVTS